MVLGGDFFRFYDLSLISLQRPLLVSCNTCDHLFLFDLYNLFGVIRLIIQILSMQYPAGTGQPKLCEGFGLYYSVCSIFPYIHTCFMQLLVLNVGRLSQILELPKALYVQLLTGLFQYFIFHLIQGSQQVQQCFGAPFLPESDIHKGLNVVWVFKSQIFSLACIQVKLQLYSQQKTGVMWVYSKYSVLERSTRKLVRKIP